MFFHDLGYPPSPQDVIKEKEGKESCKHTTVGEASRPGGKSLKNVKSFSSSPLSAYEGDFLLVWHDFCLDEYGMG